MRKLLLAAVGVAGMAYAALTLPSCIDSLGFGGSGGADGGYDAGFDIVQGGESCTKPDPASIRAHFEPSVLYLTPCSTEPCPARTAKLVIEPDICDVAPVDAENPDAGFQIVANETVVTFTPADDTIVRAPMPTADESCSTDTTEFCVGYHRPAIPVRVEAGASAGSTTLAATFEFGGEKFASQLRVEVMPDATPKCSGTAKKSKLSAGETLAGKGGLLGASIAIPKGANRSEDGFVWSVKPFDATIGCAADIVPKGMFALGPAVTFGPEDTAWQREVPVTIPINPALLPEKARLRHVRVAYSGPAFKAPRSIPVADPRIVQVDGQWALSFQIPRLGTYQAVVPGDAGAHSFTRRLTHRAVIGISMGGGGTAMMGLRHHDKFDAIAPLGGPVDWTWELDYIEKNHLGGFRPIAPGTTLADLQATYGQDLSGTSCMHDADCQSDERCLGVSTTAPATAGRCVVVPPATEPYEHPQVFNAWWYEFPSSGNGGTFSRQDYIQIFRDLAIMFGNPNGENLAKGGENLPAGVRPDGKSVLGDHPNGECKINVDPVDCSSDPDPAACKKQNPQEKQQEIAQSCPIERCDHNVSLDHYYDDEYNPDGAFPVITVCDSSPQLPGATPWSNVWQPGFTSFPLEVGLAVDYNGNGVRDAMEPIIRAGHEKWYDDGVDHTPSSLEPGYEKGKNDDPNGDDYNAQYNPSGTEGDHRYEFGERFEDYGLDGVKGTKQQPADGWKKPGDGYDVGEGDGKFTVARGLQEFWDRDAHSIVRGLTDPSKIPGGELNAAALQRLDVWTDGGTRDLFNFSVDAQNLAGAFYARGRDVQYLTEFANAPGQDPKSGNFDPKYTVWEDLPGVVFQRYGATVPSQVAFDDGTGQHVGTGSEIIERVQSAMYFLASRWPEPELRTLSARSKDDPAPGVAQCEIDEKCDFDFSHGGRTGPVSVALPPGYGNRFNQQQRYPVIYFLHGYGQDPSGLSSVEALFTNWMADPAASIATRFPKVIVVYVDGRCRWQNGKAECLRGSFFTDSVMAQGSQDESWWLALMDEVDRRFRTMPEGAADWTE